MQTITKSTRRLFSAAIKKNCCDQNLGKRADQLLQTELVNLRRQQQLLLQQRSSLLNQATDESHSERLANLDFRSGCYIAARSLNQQVVQLRSQAEQLAERRRLVSLELAKISQKISGLEERLRQDKRLRRAAADNLEASEIEERAVWGAR